MRTHKYDIKQEGDNWVVYELVDGERHPVGIGRDKVEAEQELKKYITGKTPEPVFITKYDEFGDLIKEELKES